MHPPRHSLPGLHLVHNIAIRKAQQELPHLRFLAFTHSFPAARPQEMEYPFSARFTDLPRTNLSIPPARASRPWPAVRRAEGRCAVVYNTLPLIPSMSDAVQEVARHMDLIRPELLAVYPARLTTGKRLEKVAALAGAIRTAAEQEIKVIFCDFPSADIPPKVYKAMIRTEGKKYGLRDEDLLFTSDIGFPDGFPGRGCLSCSSCPTCLSAPPTPSPSASPCWRPPAGATSWCSIRPFPL